LAGNIYGKLPESLGRQLNDYYPSGGRPRIAPILSNHNPYHRRDRNKLICQDCERGLTSKEIAEKFYLSKRRIQLILKENGLSGKRDIKDISRVERIRLALKMGEKKASIARREGICRNRVYQIIEEEGLR